MTEKISVLIHFYFPRSWPKTLHNKYCGSVTGLCFSSVKRLFPYLNMQLRKRNLQLKYSHLILKKINKSWLASVTHKM